MKIKIVPQHRRKRTINKTIIYGSCIALVALLIVCLILCFVRPTSEQPEEMQTFNPSIAIPGYEGLWLEANSKRQNVALSNPQSNTCYFQITLSLEDGTILWESELIAPGTSSKPMRLTEKLEEGTYPNAVLHYSCYRMDKDLTPLNGAQTKLTLWVQ